MKRKFIFLSGILLLIKFNINAQSSKIEPIDFLNLTRKPTIKVDYKDIVILKIVNINRNIYKVQGEAKETAYNVVIPDILKGIKLPGYLTKAVPVWETGEVETLWADSARMHARAQPLISLNTDYKTLLENAKKLDEVAVLNNQYINLLKDCSHPYQTIEADKINNTNKYISSRSSESNIIKLRSNLEKLLNDLITNSMLLVERMKTNSEIVIKQKKTTIAALGIEIKKYEDRIKQLPEAQRHYSYTAYSDIKTSIQRTSAQVEEEKEELNQTSEQYKAAKEIAEKMNQFRKDNKIAEILENYDKINPSTFQYILEIPAKKDEVSFNVKITSEGASTCNNPKEVTVERSYYVHGGVKVDFSTGVFINRGDEDFLGRELSYEKVNDSVVKIKSAERGKRLLLSVGALVHIYWRMSEHFNLALSPGVSTTTAFDGLIFHLGLSGMLGTKNRLVITAGASAREAKVLDNRFEYDKAYSKKIVPESPPTIKVFPNWGGFIAVTYNWNK